MGESLRLVLADRHALFVDALAEAMRAHHHQVLGTTTTWNGLIKQVSEHQPDVCVIDTSFDDGGGVAAIREISERAPATKVVVLTADVRETTMRSALDAGARGYVHKSRGIESVVRLLRRISRGEVVVAVASPHPPATTIRSAHQLRQLAAFLTPRERECLAMLAHGMDTVEIAKRLGVSAATVRSHVQAVLTKLGVRNRLEAASLAIRHGLITIETAERISRHA
ncbi:MAG TPA: response regulator transcription factor [Jatrophihabitans sp.]|nr:response regulator transcription factor [Jatrophihabitans sp.]